MRHAMLSRLGKARAVCAVTSLVASGGAVLAQMAPSWVWPTFSTVEAVEKQLTVIDRYRYREQLYDPPVTIGQGVPKAGQRYGTPEEAMISRVSAMMAQDYDWWLETWDAESRQLTMANNEAMERTPEFFLQWWGDTFEVARLALTRRVETGPYVVITYRVLAPSGEDVGGGVEFPVVFHRVEDRWSATLALREDPLVPASPWVSGESRIEQIVR